MSRSRTALSIAGTGVIIALLAAGVYAGVASAQGPGFGPGYGGMMGGAWGNAPSYGGPGMGYGYGGMMGGGWGNAPSYSGPGMGYGYGGMMGGGWGNTPAYGGPGMMYGNPATSGCPMWDDSAESGVAPATDRLTIDEAQGAVEQYLVRLNYGDDLQIAEVMEFERNFYAEIVERSSGVHAFELLVDPLDGRVWPEYGPNMMWNTKYGGMGHAAMAGWWSTPDENAMTIEANEAVSLAQRYLDEAVPGWTAGEPETFYGYYTLHTYDAQGNITGMISVNGYTGATWYHNWHGALIAMSDEPLE